MSSADKPSIREDVSTAGVDVSLIDEMLRLTPAERLRQNDRAAALVAALQAAFVEANGHKR